MASALDIRSDYSAADLRRLAKRSKDNNQSRRLLSLAAVMDGMNRTDAARIGGMDRQTLRDWVHRYNRLGVDGLKSLRSPGPTPVLSEQQMAELKALAIAGPDPDIHKVVRWRCADLRGEVTRRFDVTVHESTIGKWMHKLGLVRLQPRPVHPQKDPEAEAAFKKTSPAW